MVRDSDIDKMFLVKGAKKYVLIDSGMGRGALKQFISQFAGDMPIEVIFTHNHGDHIGQADEFIRDSVERIGEADKPGLLQLLKSRGLPADVVAKNVVAAHGRSSGRDRRWIESRDGRRRAAGGRNGNRRACSDPEVRTMRARRIRAEGRSP